MDDYDRLIYYWRMWALVLFCIELNLGSLLHASPAVDVFTAGTTNAEAGQASAKLYVQDGQVLFLRFSKEKPQKIEYRDQNVSIFELDSSAKDFKFGALVAIPPESKPGPDSIKVIFEASRSESLSFEIVSAQYPTEQLKVTPSRGVPKPKNYPRIQREQKEIGKIYKNHSGARYWNAAFQKPLNSDLTSVFGNRRVFNGKTQSFHAGTDFRAPEGTPVLSPAAGIVVLAKDLFFSGNTLILDHGQGLYSIFAHLSKYSTKVGDKVKAGQVIGKSGMTGRASGPHLHWGVVVNGIKVDPLSMIQSAITERGF